jgi:pimeloyl-ACP methyl ester carboxylesterase
MKEPPGRDVILHYANYPVLFMIGEHDNLLPKHVLLDQASIAKKGKSVLLENSGHMGFLEETNLCVKQLRWFSRACFSKTSNY